MIIKFIKISHFFFFFWAVESEYVWSQRIINPREGLITSAKCETGIRSACQFNSNAIPLKIPHTISKCDDIQFSLPLEKFTIPSKVTIVTNFLYLSRFSIFASPQSSPNKNFGQQQRLNLKKFSITFLQTSLSRLTKRCSDDYAKFR